MRSSSTSEELTIRAPGSKSQTQRALLLAALTPGESRLNQPLECDDSRVLRDALALLGAEIDESSDSWLVRGGALTAVDRPLWCGDAGTTSRFLAPLVLVLQGGVLQLSGSDRLAQRPLTPLLEALAQLGVEADHPPDRSLPVTLRRRPAAAGADAEPVISVDTSVSSQFLSGLLMIGPLLPHGLTLRPSGADGASDEPVSRPYLDMTLHAMRAFGADVREANGRFRVAPGGYRPCTFDVEGDWSGGAFLLVAGRIAGRPLRVVNLDTDSVQADRAMAAFLAELERPRPHRFDLTDCPDLIAPLAVAAALLSTTPTEIRGVAHARLKESDRIAVLATELSTAGLRVAERPDGLDIVPTAPERLQPARLHPSGDHRMAMAFGLLTLVKPGIEVLDPGCVSKSFPDFWQELERIRCPG